MLPETKRYLHIRALTKAQTLPLHDRFASVAKSPYALLLDSAGSQSDSNRFSFMFWHPSHVVLSQSKRTIIHCPQSNERTFVRGNAIDTSDDLLAMYSQSLTIGEGSKDLSAILPFQSGIAGYIGYDYGRLYLHIGDLHTGYHAPDLCIGLYQKAIIVDHESGSHYFCYVTNHSEPFDDDALELPCTGISEDQSPLTLTQPWTSNLTQQAYLKSIDAIHHYLNAGDCYQTNFAQRFSAPYTGDEFAAYMRLKDNNNAPFSAFMRLSEGAIISLSPERFLSHKDGVVQTKPIKGTRPRHPDPVIDKQQADALLSADKDRAENLMIVDLLRNDLSKHCKPFSVKVPKLFTLESYEAVHHMVSTITGELCDDTTPLTLLKDAFPGGSITGAPKVRAMEVIDELEPHGRAIYCGSIFYIGWKQDMDSSICIRTLLAEKQQLYCWAGGGIVVDSIAEDEYQETLDKVAKILPLLEKG
ncbi:aminodeoxychorismate synthase component I [Alteromonas sediminis]|uniref:aminodeoxychorismate synthase n=1 Tax=Alteromonas sediminis TaxID=2259342 RepID=A0A3N5YNP4_9ALTE|nr:aminodeoxychorismate synthase component I [Alteromonas sediminis]RPJ67321.1 aminodeoxychorismate synthase component I [Alteromonas sediminis]